MSYSESKANGDHYNGFIVPPNDVGVLLSLEYIKENCELSDFTVNVIDALYGSSVRVYISTDMVGKYLNPFFLSMYVYDSNAVDFTFIKKSFRMGSGASSLEQDLHDLKHMCHIAKIYGYKMKAYSEIEELCQKEIEGLL